MTTNDNEWQRAVQLVTTNGTTSDNEWQRVTTSGATSDNEWQRVTTSDNEWYNEWQRMTTNGNEWQRVTAVVQRMKTAQYIAILSMTKQMHCYFKGWMAAIRVIK